MSRLSEILQEMLDETMRSDTPARRTLPNGLHITIKAGTDKYTIVLSRDMTAPSGKEWETVFRHFPYYVDMPNATATTLRNKRLALYGQVPKRQAQALRLL